MSDRERVWIEFYDEEQPDRTPFDVAGEVLLALGQDKKVHLSFATLDRRNQDLIPFDTVKDLIVDVPTTKHGDLFIEYAGDMVKGRIQFALFLKNGGIPTKQKETRHAISTSNSNWMGRQRSRNALPAFG